ncbi:class I SAM-dependent methyltransferase [Nonomuraea sp. SBT364]|uniref:class I SAM-dependent methyltransferase n=1 Tax=Nonomuraea sp. SBT364 TaxID=1580530 RepID=UPI00066B4D42|nr:class I SAM-dependent methyltransferase [Nonomuraea sp. SBT364]
MRDYYREFAADYHWLFPDEIVSPPGVLGGTSTDSIELIEAVAGGLPPGARVLDCACGIGTDVMALAHRGFRVTGTDGSAAMVERARLRLPGHDLRTCSWQDLPDTLGEPYELVLCLGNSLVHTGSPEAMVAALSAMRKVLAPGGTLVVDSRNWELLHRERPRIVPAPEVRRRDGVRCRCLYVWDIPEEFGPPCRAEVVMLLEPDGGPVTHRRHVIDFHPFTPGDLATRLREAGFDVTGTSYRPDRARYAISARPAP